MPHPDYGDVIFVKKFNGSFQNKAQFVQYISALAIFPEIVPERIIIRDYVLNY